MKYIISGTIIIFGIAIGLIIGLGLLEGFEFVLVLFVIFPIVIIFGTLYLGRNKTEPEIDEELKKQDRFSKWE